MRRLGVMQCAGCAWCDGRDYIDVHILTCTFALTPISYPTWESAVSRRELFFATVLQRTADSMEGGDGDMDNLLRARVANTLGAVRRATNEASTHAHGLTRLKAAIGWVKAANAITPSCRLSVSFDINSANIGAKLHEFSRAGLQADSTALLPLLGALAS